MTRIKYQRGDIFDSKAHVIVNTVNCEGVMGKGLALAFKERYPAMFAVYQQDCKTRKLRIGRPTLYKASTPWILNFPTKDHWRPPSKLEYLEKGLEYLAANYQKAGIQSIAFPKLGAQNGKLSWDDVGPLMAKYLSQLDIDVYVYITEGDTEYQYDAESDIKTREQTWKEFSELARSIDRLHQEVGLNAKDAKRVAQRRESMEFKALSDIDHIDGLAKTSLKKIKEYIDHQQFTALELFSLTNASTPSSKVTKDATRPVKRKRKKRNTTSEVSTETLFSVKELVS
jgi:O-acetyl-ADP-ribose deacetylase (regulator of RNase III)